jgi:hypothetical protein
MPHWAAVLANNDIYPALDEIALHLKSMTKETTGIVNHNHPIYFFIPL